MHHTATIVLSVSLSAAAAQAQLLSNSFENHGATQTQFNLSNATLGATFPGVTGFGGASEIDLITSPGFAGATPIRGNWMLGMSAHAGGTTVDAFSMALVLPIVSGSIYHMTLVGFQGSPGSPGTVQIGISNSPTQFGAPLETFTPSAAWGWTTFQMDFLAQNSGGYLTFRAAGDNSYVMIDDILLTPTPNAAAALGLGVLAMMRRRR